LNLYGAGHLRPEGSWDVSSLVTQRFGEIAVAGWPLPGTASGEEGKAGRLTYSRQAVPAFQGARAEDVRRDALPTGTKPFQTSERVAV
jgi:hypothetical protein